MMTVTATADLLPATPAMRTLVRQIGNKELTLAAISNCHDAIAAALHVNGKVLAVADCRIALVSLEGEAIADQIIANIWPTLVLATAAMEFIPNAAAA